VNAIGGLHFARYLVVNNDGLNDDGCAGRGLTTTSFHEAY
jgi:hypothetical protein